MWAQVLCVMSEQKFKSQDITSHVFLFCNNPVQKVLIHSRFQNTQSRFQNEENVEQSYSWCAVDLQHKEKVNWLYVTKFRIFSYLTVTEIRLTDTVVEIIMNIKW